MSGGSIEWRQPTREAPHGSLTITRNGATFKLAVPAAGDLLFDRRGTRIEGPFGAHHLDLDSDPPSWVFLPNPWAAHIEATNVLRRDVLAYLDNADDEARVLAARIRKEHW